MGRKKGYVSKELRAIAKIGQDLESIAQQEEEQTLTVDEASAIQPSNLAVAIYENSQLTRAEYPPQIRELLEVVGERGKLDEEMGKTDGSIINLESSISYKLLKTNGGFLITMPALYFLARAALYLVDKVLDLPQGISDLITSGGINVSSVFLGSIGLIGMKKSNISRMAKLVEKLDAQRDEHSKLETRLGLYDRNFQPGEPVLFRDRSGTTRYQLGITEEVHTKTGGNSITINYGSSSSISYRTNGDVFALKKNGKCLTGKDIGSLPFTTPVLVEYTGGKAPIAGFFGRRSENSFATYNDLDCERYQREHFFKDIESGEIKVSKLKPKILKKAA